MEYQYPGSVAGESGKLEQVGEFWGGEGGREGGRVW